MANNIGYSFEITYEDVNSDKKWLSFKNQDGIVLSNDKQSGYTTSVQPKDLILEALDGIGEKTNDNKRTAFITFKQNGTNESQTFKIEQDTDKSKPPTLTGSQVDKEASNIKIYSANNFNFNNIIPSSGGTAYIIAKYTKVIKQSYIETDRYGNELPYDKLITSDPSDLTDISSYSSNFPSYTTFDSEQGFIKVNISENKTNKYRNIIISATFDNITGASQPIQQEGSPVDYTFRILTNYADSSAVFVDANGHEVKTAKVVKDNNPSNDKYYAEYTTQSTVEPKMFGYVVNSGKTYSDGQLKLYNEYNNLTMVRNTYTWANASTEGDELQVIGIYNGTEHFYAQKYTHDAPLILSASTDGNYIELIPSARTASSDTISASAITGSVSVHEITKKMIEITVPKVTTTETTEGTSSSTKPVLSSVEIWSTLDPNARQLLNIKQIIE